MFRQLTRVGNVAPRNLFIEFMHEVRAATRLFIERTQKVFKVY